MTRKCDFAADPGMHIESRLTSRRVLCGGIWVRVPAEKHFVGRFEND